MDQDRLEKAFLDHRYLLYGDLHSKVTPCNHDSIYHIQNSVYIFEGLGTFYLGNDKGIITCLGCRFLQGQDIIRALDKGFTYRINTLLQGEFKALVISIRKRADAEINAGEVDSLVGTELPPHHYLAMYLFAIHLFHFELNKPVIDKDGITWAYYFGQPFKVN